MLAWKPLQNASAFRVYCKGIGLDIADYDEVAKNLDEYSYSKKWKNIIEESKRFVGVIESISDSPCSMILYNKPIRKELGLVRTSKDKFCCLLDGYNCDKYKYLKNDYLTVTVWAIIRDVCQLANISIPTIRELDELLDEKTFDIYKNKLTCTINQADSDYATGLVAEYKPQNLPEMSAFVAIIRPGCASLLHDFINRKPYTTGVKELDELLIEGSHRMIYQELIMKYLIWLGIPETGSYDIIKKIAKKKFKEEELSELRTKLSNGWKERVGDEEKFGDTWTVVEQAAKYSFNASHSLSYAYDSLYGAYLKAHFPLEYYTVAMNYYQDDRERTTKLTKELSFFGIQLKPIKFRYSQSLYSLSREDNSIYKGMQSIKNMSKEVSDDLFSLKDNKYESFIDLLYDIKEKTKTDSKQLRILIELDFFSEFGDINFLLCQYELFLKLYGKSQIKKDKLSSLGLVPEQVKNFSIKATEKQFNGVDMKALMKSVTKDLIFKRRALTEKIHSQIEYLGYIDILGDQYAGLAVVLEVETKYTPKLKMHSLKNGNIVECKINKKTFNNNKLSSGDLVKICGQTKKPKQKRLENGTYEYIEGTSEIWITSYNKMLNL